MKIEYIGGNVVVTIPVNADTAKAAPVSKTGRSRMIATTGGFRPVDGAPEGVRIGINLIGKV